MTIQTSRRTFLAAAASAFTVGVALPGSRAKAGVVASRLPLNPEKLATYISINADGSAVGWIGKIDMGQGTDVGWAQMIAEELDLPVEKVSIVQGHTDVTFNMGGASGSTRSRIASFIQRVTTPGAISRSTVSSLIVVIVP